MLDKAKGIFKLLKLTLLKRSQDGVNVTRNWNNVIQGIQHTLHSNTMP